MIVLAYFDWYGTEQELKELDEIIDKECAKIDGMKNLGRYGPHNRKYHFCRVFETDTYPLPSLPVPRDYNKMTHWVSEILQGPL